jgi:peptide/nickel transport system ATP-binding protein
MTRSGPALEIEDLQLRFGGAPEATLRGVSMRVDAGEIVGVVGESGSGKSLTALTVLRLEPPGAVVSATCLRVAGRDLRIPTRQDLQAVRGPEVSMIFQDPMAALSPTRRIGDQIGDVLHRHRGQRGRAGRAEAENLLEAVHIRDPRDLLRRYPFELSGGMRQRVLIAMAFVSQPRLVLADEITTAIDASLRRVVLDLIVAQAAASGAAVLLVSHDLNVIRSVCRRVYVMRAGEVVEAGPVEAILTAPQAAYTRMLIAAMPELHAPRRPLLATEAAP